MSVQPIYAEKTVSVTELRKKPGDYFIDEPVAVLSNNKATGYTLSADLFEQMLKLLETQSAASTFRPSQTRFAEISEKGAKLLLSMDDNDLSEFIE
ncbi:type I toxin-antitoxin system antitoxin YafN [Thalassotalea litorea]|uniref:type I toxin-antitoxin system antitoxin YafN n=1 Tax=Thalassotalea litorea TaxID=2020715 RepID=UPI0037359D94